jgi:DNA mismatch endonuclease (patch repair protein)
MSRVRSVDTKPERRVRSLIHRLGYRYRLHKNELPGKPDLIFPALGKLIFVHGCFWHGHRCPSGQNRPNSNTLYWTSKLDGNKKRDRTNNRKLRRLGWNILILWECQLNNEAALQERIEEFLGRRRS